MSKEVGIKVLEKKMESASQVKISAKTVFTSNQGPIGKTSTHLFSF